MIVLTNDDGIDAPGIQALLQALDGKAAIVAPMVQQSGCGHQVTTDRPIRVEQRGDHAWAVEGTPADCTRIALTHLYPQTKWVLSGINAGGNMGSDVYVSGTVAAVREAALHRVGGIAISHYRNRKRPYNWEQASQWTRQLVTQLMAQPIEPGSFWNINLPHLDPTAQDPDVIRCKPCTQPLPVGFRVEADRYIYQGEYSARRRDTGSDVDVCLSGRIAIVQLWV
ncbi:5'/3'-nucleotidase SurE [Alkalinema pantanalense CENA528]|uniref:5'/3'-nucleotidase SurE n=1 Tax=Alkalinema pantanalense TaxID=1620705 RepID=UPI003D6E6AD8